jgi:hypothetical protein
MSHFQKALACCAELKKEYFCNSRERTASSVISVTGQVRLSRKLPHRLAQAFLRTADKTGFDFRSSPLHFSHPFKSQLIFVDLVIKRHPINLQPAGCLRDVPAGLIEYPLDVLRFEG